MVRINVLFYITPFTETHRCKMWSNLCRQLGHFDLNFSQQTACLDRQSKSRHLKSLSLIGKLVQLSATFQQEDLVTGLNHNDGSLPFHGWTNGYLPLETIEKSSCPMVAGLQNHWKTIGTTPKTIKNPLVPMVCQTKNHWYQWFSDQKPLKKHWYQWWFPNSSFIGKSLLI